MKGHVFIKPARRPRTAFTLVELLVVIVIIGILIALLIPAVNAAITTARNGAMSVEIGTLSQALEAYRRDYGAYPPDFAGNDLQDNQAIDNHLARQFRYRNKTMDRPKSGKFVNLDPSEALYFWLRGFSTSDQLPLTGPSRQPIFEFDETRLSDADGDGFFEYYPRYSEQPYVYLHHSSYDGLTTNNVPISTNVVVKPYVRSSSPANQLEFVEPEKYQLLCAGQDNKFLKEGLGRTDRSQLPQYPDGLGYTEEDEDNLANFSEGSTLEDAIP